MATRHAHCLNGFGLVFLSAFLQCAAGCSDNAERAAPRDEGAHVETPDGGGDGAPPPTISVHGKVLDSGNTPLAGVPVLIGSHPLALTDTSGQFTVPNVSPPYTATVLLSSSKAVVVYEGLSRPDPKIVALASATLPRNAGVQGTLAGGSGYPEAALTRTFVQLAAPGVYGSTPGPSSSGENIFILPPDCISWTGPTTIQGTLHALQFTHAAANNFKPIDYKGYGALADVTLTHGENEIAIPITLGPIGKVTFRATATMPPDYAVTDKRPQLVAGGRVIRSLPSDNQPGPDIDYPLPTISSTTVKLTVAAENASTGATSTTTQSGLALDAQNATIGILPSPTLVLPVDKATGVNESTPFSWTRLDDGVHMLVLAAGPGHPQYQIVTSATEAHLPELTSAGIQLPPATTYQWLVAAYAPFASVDAYAGSDIADRDNAPALYDARSGMRSFTTAP
ncbi:MAG: hypothetical protein K0S65_6258 [Labilithrix sp.]|nr:hypothetical protein [Labilithrix sp.]